MGLRTTSGAESSFCGECLLSVMVSILKRDMQAALHLGLRQMEWLFLTCLNYWIVCRLVRDDIHPYLAYSSEISIEDSSEPFRAFLGAILSVDKGIPVEPSVFSSKLVSDATSDSETCGHDEHENTERGSSLRSILDRNLSLQVSLLIYS